MTDYVEAKCAVCQLFDGLVVNVIMALPSDPPQDGCQLIEIMADQICGIGWYWDGTNFNPPIVPEELPPILEVTE